MPLIERETREQEPVTMHPTAAEIRAGRIILAIAVVLAFGILALGINSWLTRGQRAASGPAAVPTASPVATPRSVPTQPVVAAATSTPMPISATTTSQLAVAPTATGRSTAPASTAIPTSAPTSSGTSAIPTLQASATAGVGPQVTNTPDPRVGHVPELDPAEEAQRKPIGKVGDGAAGDRAANVVKEYYTMVTQAYTENKPELLKPLMTDDKYQGYLREIKDTHTNPQSAFVPVISYRIQPVVLTGLDPNTYTVAVAEIRYDRRIDPATGKGIGFSQPYRKCARWFLIEEGGSVKIEGSTVIPERHCDAGWPDPPTPSKE